MEKRSLENQPDKVYKKEEFPLPKERTFDEWVTELETSNRVNLMNTNCLQVTSIQWNELKGIIKRLDKPKTYTHSDDPYKTVFCSGCGTAIDEGE